MIKFYMIHNTARVLLAKCEYTEKAFRETIPTALGQARFMAGNEVPENDSYSVRFMERCLFHENATIYTCNLSHWDFQVEVEKP